MSLTYAGQPLAVPTQETLDWVRANIDPTHLVQQIPRSWPGNTMEAIGWRGLMPHREVRVGCLRWPVGASRYACGHFLADTEALNAIDTVVGSVDGKRYEPADFVMGDGEKEFSTRLYLLPVRPLARPAPGHPGLFLITLVDERYFWWFYSGEITISRGSTTWEDLYEQIATHLEVDIDVDEVPDAYLYPDVSLAINYRPLPLLLDAVAASCGQRIVRYANGTIKAMNARTSLLRHLANRDRCEPYRTAGHTLDLTVTLSSGS